MRSQFVAGLICCLGFALPVSSSAVWALQTTKGPDKNESVVNVDLAEVNLAGKATGSRLTLNPGTAMGVHKHDGRTSIIIVVQGTLTEHRGDVVREFRQGEVVHVANQTTHFNENRGTVPLVYVEINISANQLTTANAGK